MVRMIDADRLLDALNSIILDYTSEGKYPDGFGIDDAINLVEGAPHPHPAERVGERGNTANGAGMVSRRDFGFEDREI